MSILYSKSIQAFVFLSLVLLIPGFFQLNVPITGDMFRVCLMAKWGFAYFCAYLEFNRIAHGEKFTPKKVLLDADFLLIQDIVHHTKTNLRSNQIVHALVLFDRFLASKRLLIDIIPLFCDLICNQKVALPKYLLDMPIWNNVWQHLSDKMQVRENDFGIGIDGLEMNENSRMNNFYLLLNLSKLFKGIHLKNFRIKSREIEIFQSMLHSKLISIRLENCSFDLDFSCLNALTYFDCLNCDNAESMLSSLSSYALQFLNISKCKVSSNIFSLIAKHQRLENFYFSSNEISTEDQSFSFDFLFEFPVLLTVDLSNNAIANEFVNALSCSEFTLPWEQLNLANVEMEEEEFELFCKNIWKFQYLTHLNLSEDTKNKCINPFGHYIRELSRLEELSLNGYPSGIEYLLDTLIETNRKVKIISSSFQYPSDTIHLPYLTKVCLNYLEIGRFNYDEDYYGITELSLDLARFFCDDFSNFFRKFTNLTSLEVYQSNNEEYLDSSDELYENDFKQLSEALSHCHLKKLKLCGGFTEKFFDNLNNLQWWNYLEEFDCTEISSRISSDTLKKIKMPNLKKFSLSISNESVIFRGINDFPSVRILEIILEDEITDENTHYFFEFFYSFRKITNLIIKSKINSNKNTELFSRFGNSPLKLGNLKSFSFDNVA